MESTDKPAAVTGVRRAFKGESAKKSAEYKAAHYQKNKERYKALNRAWVEKNKESVKAYKAEHYQANKARYKENNLRWIETHKDRVRELKRLSARRFRSNHRDRLLAERRDAYRLNPGPQIAKARHSAINHPEWARSNEQKRRESGYFSAWKRNNKDKVNAATRRRRSRISRCSYRYSHRDVDRLLRSSNGLCYWCGGSLSGGYEIDHVWPIAKGGKNHVGNLCLSCPTCNRKKQAKSPQEFAGVLL